MDNNAFADLIPQKEKNAFADLVPNKQEDSTLLDEVGAYGRAALTKPMLGGSFADEILAVPATVGTSAIRAMRGEPLDVSGDYVKNMGNIQDQFAEDREIAPISTFMGDLAGDIRLGGKVLKGFGRAAPKTSATMQQFARNHPFLASVGIGGAGGSVYGFGATDGDLEERARSSMVAGATGAGLGPVGAYAGKKLGPLTEKVMKYLEKKKASQVAPAAQNILDDAAPTKDLIRKDGEIFSKTKGQSTQSTKAQRVENDALANLSGEKAQTIMQQSRIAQSRERNAFLSQLGDIDKVGNPNDVLESVFDTIKSQAKSLKGQVDNAYSLAREGGGTKISVEDIKDGLFANVMKVKREGAYDLAQIPLANARAKDLAKLVRKSGGGKFTQASLNAMENYRTRITNSMASTMDKTERRFLGQMLESYDDFMYKTANEAVDKSDEDAILAFRDAVRKRREYGKLYEADKFVNDVVTGKKGLDDAVKDLIGTGSIVGKKRMESTYDALIKAAGSDAKAVQQDLRTAFAKKLLEQSIEGLEEGGENAFLSAAKTQSALKGLFVNNKNFAKKLYGEDIVMQVQRAIDELEKIKTSQPSTKNPSGSGEMVLRYINQIPGINFIGQGFEIAKRESMAGKVKRSVGDVIKDTELPIKSQMFGSLAAGSSAAQMQ